MAKKLFTITTLLALSILTGCQTQQVSNPIALSRLTGDHWQIWTMKPDGSKAKQITESSSDKRYPVWSKDGQDMFCRTNNNQIFVIDLASGKESPFLESFGLSGGVAPSPDGGKFLLVRYRTQLKDSSSLWLTEAEGKNSRILTTDAGLQYDPDWSPDGKKIAYIYSNGYRTNEIYIIDSDGKNKHKLTDNDALELLPAFSPDSKTIAYVSDVTGNYEIWLMDADGSNRRQLTDSKGIDTRPCWSSDGSKIMFASSRSGELQLWIMDKDGGNLKQLTKGSSSMDPAWRRNKP
jgi:TolB protein